MSTMEKTTKRSRKQYASLEPRVKILSEKTIRRRWKRLPVTTQLKLADLLRTIERSALSHGGHEKKGINAQSIVSDSVDQLIQRIPRMPFPPGTDDLTFDFELTINRQRVLEDQLTASTHTIALLSAEVGAETELLNKERTELEALENAAAKTEASDGNRARLHPVVRDSSGRPPPRLPLEYEWRLDGKAPVTPVSDLGRDLGVRPVIDELQRHLSSVENHSEAPDKISAALSSSQAALGVFNWKKLQDAQYRQIYRLNAA